MTNKYTFADFVGAIEGDDFDNPTQEDLAWGYQFIDNFPDLMKSDHHGGGCTKESYTCSICIYQILLLDYERYVFDEENWRKENDIISHDGYFIRNKNENRVLVCNPKHKVIGEFKVKQWKYRQ